jgi:rubrerythrin
MDFFDMAKNLEIENRKMYEGFSVNAPVKEFMPVFSFLAGQEQQHYDLLASLQKKVAIAVPVDDNALLKAKQLLAQWGSQLSLPSTLNDYESAYNKALIAERQTVAFYTEEQSTLKNSEHKKILDLIIEQEKRHAILLESLIEFTRRPKEWIENAEFNHLDQY